MYKGTLVHWIDGHVIMTVEAKTLPQLKRFATVMANRMCAAYDVLRVTEPDGGTSTYSRNNIRMYSKNTTWKPDSEGWKRGLPESMISKLEAV